MNIPQGRGRKDIRDPFGYRAKNRLESLNSLNSMDLCHLYIPRELHARIHMLLSLRYGVYPSAKEGGGDVAITSLFYAPPLLRYCHSACRSFHPLCFMLPLIRCACST